MHEADDRETFEAWLADFDDALDAFLGTFLPRFRSQLDFSPASLHVIERLLLDEFATFEATRQPQAAKRLDGYARYVGEVFRKGLGGKWTIRLDDPDDAFHGIPILVGMKGGEEDCPLATVSAATDRRTGEYFNGIYEALGE